MANFKIKRPIGRDASPKELEKEKVATKFLSRCSVMHSSSVGQIPNGRQGLFEEPDEGQTSESGSPPFDEANTP